MHGTRAQVLTRVAHLSKVDPSLLRIIWHSVNGEDWPQEPGAARKEKQDSDNAQRTARRHVGVGGELLDLDMTIHISALDPKLPPQVCCVLGASVRCVLGASVCNSPLHGMR